ncbi:MAG TPA: histidine kinase [Cytophagales bacterium]|nr:histidine kinase [Cytophagales bacterium]
MIQKKSTILLHIIFCIVNTFYCIVFWGNPLEIPLQLLMLVPFYFNYFIMVPWVLQKNSITRWFSWGLLYWTINLIIYFGYYLTLSYFLKFKSGFPYVDIIGSSINATFFMAAASTGSRLSVEWLKNKKKNSELLSLKNMTELRLMKSNINIPFMIKVLENLEYLTHKSPDVVGEQIILFSNVLRHGLYDTQASSISLNKELKVLKEYISIINCINHGTMNLAIHSNYLGLNIAPNLLIRFIGTWMETHNLDINNAVIMSLNTDHATIFTQLPVKDEFLAKEHFLRTFPTYTDAWFDVSYEVSKEFITLKIINLTQ